MQPWTDKTEQRSVAMWTVTFVVLLTLAIFQLDGEWGQVALAFLANVVFGYAIGRMLPGRPRSLYVGLGLATGVGLWLLLVISSLIFFPGAAAYPLFNWFVRFALGGGLWFITGAVIGDLAVRGKLTITGSALASAFGIAGSVVTLIKGG